MARTQNQNCIRIEDIDCGERVRKDLGDINALANSIREVGLLQPVVVDSDGKLIATARHEFETAARGNQFADPREMYLNDTTIPARLVSILQSHGMFTVGDLLLAGLAYLSERKNIGRVSVEVIVESLLEVGITREHFYGGTHG